MSNVDAAARASTVNVEPFASLQMVWFKPEMERLHVEYVRGPDGLDGVKVSTVFRADVVESALIGLLRDHAQPLLRVAYLEARKRKDTEFMQRLAVADDAICSALARAAASPSSLTEK